MDKIKIRIRRAYVWILDDNEETNTEFRSFAKDLLLHTITVWRLLGIGFVSVFAIFLPVLYGIRLLLPANRYTERVSTITALLVSGGTAVGLARKYIDWNRALAVDRSASPRTFAVSMMTLLIGFASLNATVKTVNVLVEILRACDL